MVLVGGVAHIRGKGRVEGNAASLDMSSRVERNPISRLLKALGQ